MLGLVRLEKLADRKTSQLSGGQQQRVALARALAPKPRSCSSTKRSRHWTCNCARKCKVELKRLQLETGITFIFVTHDQEEALTMSDRIAVMSAGRIQQIGQPREIYMHPVNRFVASFIGETNFLGGHGGAGRDPAGLRRGGGGGGHRPTHGPCHACSAARTGAPRPGGRGGYDPARIESQVYFGTDTHFHLRLSDETEVVARLQSPPRANWRWPKGRPWACASCPARRRSWGNSAMSANEQRQIAAERPRRLASVAALR